MAKIKTVKFDFEGKEYPVNLNCSTNGVFSCNLPCKMQNNLGLSGRLEYSSLKELEDTLSKAFQLYIESVTTYDLMIHIRFKASGKFMECEDGSVDKRFFPIAHSPLAFLRYQYDIGNTLAFDYRILARKNCDGRLYFYGVKHESEIYGMSRYSGWDNNIVNGYIPGGEVSICSDSILIPYSEKSIKSLQSIENQLQKASMFLLDLVTADSIASVLERGFTKQLTE